MSETGSIPSTFVRLAPRAPAIAAACLVLLGAAACGGGTSTGTSPAGSTTAVAEAPDFTLQGCTYVLDNTVPPGEPQGVKPEFPPFTPDASATAALEMIKAHGGTAMVDSVTLSAGTWLYAGPDTDQAEVGAIPSGHSILAAEPVVWTTHSGGLWLAFFLSCGGDNLYWVSVQGITHQNPSAGDQIATQIEQLKQAPPYTQSNQASMLPIVIDSHKHLVFADTKVTFLVGRGELDALPA